MAMGHEDDEQEELFNTHAGLRKGGGHPFYEALDKVLRANGFDRFVESLCEPFYAQGGRPGIPPGVYFRGMLVGFCGGGRQRLSTHGSGSLHRSPSRQSGSAEHTCSSIPVRPRCPCRGRSRAAPLRSDRLPLSPS